MLSQPQSPDFIILGAHKAGTTSLHHYLNQHPNIFLPADKGRDLLSHSVFKEFGKTDDYIAQFNAAQPGQCLGEVSSVYLHQDETFVQNLRQTFPNLILITVLRNPIERTYSHAFWNRTYTKGELQNIDQIIINSPKFLRPGLYAEHLKRYWSFFAKDQVNVFLYDDFQNNSQAFMAKIYKTVGVDPTFALDMKNRYHSGSLKLSNYYQSLLKKGYSVSPALKKLLPHPLRRFIRTQLKQRSQFQKPSMSYQLRRQLATYFHDDVMELQDMTGLQVSHWLTIEQP